MIPHRLQLTAFGPFPRTEEVDLDALAEAGLFLLHGETGAGKTTLLDAIAFSLYGVMPGARRRAARPRCDLADPEVRTEVQLEVTLAGRRFEITRSPDQERPKRRGAGSTTEKGRLLVRELVAGCWQARSTRVDEGGQLLRGLLGMDPEQFFQVVMLPQGGFAEFLHAPADKRRELLQSLFQTERFAVVEQWLAERRRALSAAVEVELVEVGRLVARVAQAAGLDGPLPDPGAVDTEWAPGLLVDWMQRRATAELTEKGARAELRGRKAAHDAAKDLQRRQARRREALAQEQIVHVAAPAAAAAADELHAARRAGGVAAVLSELERVRRLAAETSTDEARLRAVLPAELGVADVAGLQAAARDAGAEVGGLEALAALATERDSHTRQVAALGRELVAVRARVDHAELADAARPAQRRELEGRLLLARAAADQLPAAQEAVAVLRRRLEAAEALMDQDRECERLAGLRRLADERRLECGIAWNDLRAARLDGMAAELAQALDDGAPCHVCGSPHHPSPAEPAPDAVSREDEDVARSEADAAQAEAGQAADALADAQAEQSRLSALAGPTEAGVLAADLDVSRRGLADRFALAAEALVLAGAVQDHDDRAAESRALLAGARERAAELASARQELQRAVDETAQRLDEARGADLSVPARQARLRSLVDGLEQAADAARAAAAVDQAAAELVANAERAARAAGFSSLAQAAAGGRDDTCIVRLAEVVEQHAGAATRARALLADPEHQVVLEPAADPAASGVALELAERVSEAAQAQSQDASRRCAELELLAGAVDGRLATLRPLQVRRREVADLADLAGGQGANTFRMTLSAFVLAARLEEVAAVASQRLTRMTGGRYELVHSDALAARGARSGLGLSVRDAWTGQERSTSTLSGGETFLASLALALGLADVVQAEAGGAVIGALFVDEGFGSLDEATLEEAMDVLDGLRAGGRRVGLVSHVSELRARVPHQLHVRKGRAGSTLAVVTGS